MKSNCRTRRTLIWSTASLLALAPLIFIWNSSPPVAIPPLPVPNGYDDFVAAGKQLPYLSWEDLKPDELKSALATNQPALALARKGLSKKSQIPIGFSDTYFEGSLKDLSGLKQLARALTADGKFAESEGRFDDAVDDYAMTIALGIESARGGYLINGLVQAAVATIGVRNMTPIVSRLSVVSSLHALDVIKKAESDSDSFEQFEAREKFIYMHAPFFQKLESFVMNLFAMDGEAQAKARGKTKIQASQRSVIILEGRLASHAFELQKGRIATNWNELIPAYLPAIPDDPATTNQPMKFKDF